ncbi:MAG: hypothetical protein Q4A78_08035 [Peptostreptococcaceae bacterium]|nr:hypothetical protein [Peptostreptococcaceae bacterium]
MFLREEEEFDNIRNFLLRHYRMDIRPPDEPLQPLIKSCLLFFMSAHIWKQRGVAERILSPKSRGLLQEIIACILHLISLSALQMKLPFLMMSERLLGLIPCFFAFVHADESNPSSEPLDRHSCFPVGSVKGEAMLGREEYQRLMKIQTELVEQYELVRDEICGYLHFDRALYFSNEQWLDLTAMNRLEIEVYKDCIDFLRSFFNTYMMFWDFDFYLEKIPEEEKAFIRRSIENRYGLKKKIRELFDEI